MKALDRVHLPSISSLRAFESSARHLSFTRAADELHISQSAISRHIRELELHIAAPSTLGAWLMPRIARFRLIPRRPRDCRSWRPGH